MDKLAFAYSGLKPRTSRKKKIYGVPRSMSMGRAGRFAFSIYAVVLREHPEIVKVGMTNKWSKRRIHYADWNFARGDGILTERVFLITEEYVDLAKLEAAVLSTIRHPIVQGREWFKADIDDICRTIDEVICRGGLSYTLD